MTGFKGYGNNKLTVVIRTP